MSYLDRKHTSHRTATIIAVAVVEAAAIFAVVRGLTVSFTRDPAPPRLEAEQIYLPPPPVPTPHPAPSAQPSHQPQHIIPARNDLATGPTIPIGPVPVPSASPVPMATPEPFIEPSKPQFTPRAARPVGRPSGWVTSNDYPSRDLREGNSGVTGFRLNIGSDGRVLSCAVTSSSGFPGLDRATCDNLVRRARFEPASDGSGAKVAGTYSNNIHWVIPE